MRYDAIVQTHSRPAATGLALVVLALAVCLPGCGNNPTDTQAVDPTLAAPAAGQAGSVQQVVTNQSALNEIESPFSTATGDVEGLGDVDGGSLGSYGRVNLLVSGAVADLKQAPAVGTGSRAALDAVAARAGQTTIAAIDTCATHSEPGATVTLCIQSTPTPHVLKVTITRVSLLEPVTHSVQVFMVDDAGTPLVREDDSILSYTSRSTLRDGTTLDLTMAPHAGGAIVDNTIVDLVEHVHPAHGPVVQHTHAISMNVGVVGTDADETLLSLSSAVDYRDGARATLTLEDLDPADGIASGDSLDVTAQFTAAPGNPVLQSVTTTLGLVVNELSTGDDDQVFSVSRTTVFDGLTTTGGEPTATTTFVPSAPVGRGQEPCGGHFERHATFPASWDRRTLAVTIDRTCEGGGSSTLDVTFADATTTHREITWAANGDASATTHRRDGAVVVGTYTAADHHLVVDVTEPAGRDPQSQHLDARGNPDAGTRDIVITRVHLDTGTDSLVAHAVSVGDSAETITGHTVNTNGRVDFTMQIDRTTGEVDGSASGPASQTLTYTLVRQADADGWLLTFDYRDPAQELRVVGGIVLDGDGSGCGTLAITSHGHSVTVPVCFDAGGRGRITGADGVPVPF